MRGKSYAACREESPTGKAAKGIQPQGSQGRAVANTKIGKRLFDKAISGDTTALIFWAKVRMGWKETQKVEPSLGEGGPDAQRDFEAVMAVYRGEK